jgi:SH3 domain-containing protein
MRIKFGGTAMWFLLLGLCPSFTGAQQGATNRAVVLRRDPSKSAPIIAHLLKGERLMLVQVTVDSGYFHVKTEQDQIGWVLSNYVTLSPAAPSPPTPPPNPTPVPPDSGCDSSLWSHVYHSYRLIVHQQCIAVTGTIVDAAAGGEPDGVRHEADGDTHGWLKVDAQFQNLLNTGNQKDEGGNLVFEIICRFPVTQADAKTACANYTDTVKLPPVGSHVRILGVYVQDTFHGQWMEIHPVTSITVQ